METRREDIVTSRSHCGAKEGLQEGDSRSTARTTPTAPARVPRIEHAGSGPGPRPSPKEGRGWAAPGAAPDAGRCPQHSPASRTVQGAGKHTRAQLSSHVRARPSGTLLVGLL